MVVGREPPDRTLGLVRDGPFLTGGQPSVLPRPAGSHRASGVGDRDLEITPAGHRSAGWTNRSSKPCFANFAGFPSTLARFSEGQVDVEGVEPLPRPGAHRGRTAKGRRSRVPVDGDHVLGHVVTAVAGVGEVRVTDSWRTLGGPGVRDSGRAPRVRRRARSRREEPPPRQSRSTAARWPDVGDGRGRWIGGVGGGHQRGRAAGRRRPAGVQRSTWASDRRPRSRCQTRYADVIPLASRAFRRRVTGVRPPPLEQGPSNSRVSAAGRADPAGRHRSQTTPPTEGEKPVRTDETAAGAVAERGCVARHGEGAQQVGVQDHRRRPGAVPGALVEYAQRPTSSGTAGPTVRPPRRPAGPRFPA